MSENTKTKHTTHDCNGIHSEKKSGQKLLKSGNKGAAAGGCKHNLVVAMVLFCKFTQINQ